MLNREDTMKHMEERMKNLDSSDICALFFAVG